MNEVVTLPNRINLARRVDGVEPVKTDVGRFRVCDLVIESGVAFPELIESVDGRSDCRFQVLPAGKGFHGEFTWFHRWSTPANGVWLSLGVRGEDYLLRFPDLGDFLISRDAKESRCRPLPGTPASTLRHLFLDQVIPLILSRRELLVLHASAVLTPHGAIAFVGKSGQGKSTLAACFGQIGCPLISDDYLVLRKTGQAWAAIPSYPGVRLWPEASDGVFSILPETTEIAHYTKKRRVSDPALVPFAGDHIPCAACTSSTAMVRWSSRDRQFALSDPREAFMKLVACAFNLDIRDKSLLRNQFDAIGHLRTRLPCFRCNMSGIFPRCPRFVN